MIPPSQSHCLSVNSLKKKKEGEKQGRMRGRRGGEGENEEKKEELEGEKENKKRKITSTTGFFFSTNSIWHGQRKK